GRIRPRPALAGHGLIGGPDEIAQLGRALEVFLVDGALQLVLQPLHLARARDRLAFRGRMLARVPRAAVDAAEQRAQLGLERGVAGRTAQAPGLLERRVMETAARALHRTED